MNDANKAMTSMSVGDSLDAALEAKADKTEIARLDTVLAGKEAAGTVEAHNDSASAHPDIRNELKEKLEASDLSCHNTNATAHTDIRGLFSGKEDAGTAANKVLAHNADAVAHTDIRSRLDGKVDKVSGMGLSSNDFTASEKADVAMNTGMRHNHNNKAVLDGITAAMTDDWCNAAMHMSDPVKHVTAAERTSWNGKADKTYVDSSLAGKANITDHQLKTYTSLESLGLTPGSETTESIALAMPDNSQLVCMTGANNNPAAFPASNLTGTLIVHRQVAQRVAYTWFSKGYNMYWNGYYASDTGWQGWKQLVTPADLCQPNLLDNWYFDKAVNQRRKTEYNTNGYFIDRWSLYFKAGFPGTVLLKEGYISFLPAAGGYVRIRQPLDTHQKPPNGRVVTLTIAGPNGNIPAVVVRYNSDILIGNISNQNKSLTFAYNGVEEGFYIECATAADISAVKLEYGYVSTLVNDIPPNPQQELTKCQRYFQNVLGDVLGTGYVSAGGTTAYIQVPLAVPMRTTPTLKIPSGTAIKLKSSGSIIEATGARVFTASGNAVTLLLDIPKQAINQPTAAYCADSTVQFSSEL